MFLFVKLVSLFIVNITNNSNQFFCHLQHIFRNFLLIQTIILLLFRMQILTFGSRDHNNPYQRIGLSVNNALKHMVVEWVFGITLKNTRENFTHTCNYCGKGFNQKGRYEEHISAHEERGYLCLKCNKVFRTDSLLKKHRVTCSQ